MDEKSYTLKLNPRKRSITSEKNGQVLLTSYSDQFNNLPSASPNSPNDNYKSLNELDHSERNRDASLLVSRNLSQKSTPLSINSGEKSENSPTESQNSFANSENRPFSNSNLVVTTSSSPNNPNNKTSTKVIYNNNTDQNTLTPHKNEGKGKSLIFVMTSLLLCAFSFCVGAALLFTYLAGQSIVVNPPPVQPQILAGNVIKAPTLDEFLAQNIRFFQQASIGNVKATNLSSSPINVLIQPPTDKNAIGEAEPNNKNFMDYNMAAWKNKLGLPINFTNDWNEISLRHRLNLKSPKVQKDVRLPKTLKPFHYTIQFLPLVDFNVETERKAILAQLAHIIPLSNTDKQNKNRNEISDLEDSLLKKFKNEFDAQEQTNHKNDNKISNEARKKRKSRTSPSFRAENKPNGVNQKQLLHLNPFVVEKHAGSLLKKYPSSSPKNLKKQNAKRLKRLPYSTVPHPNSYNYGSTPKHALNQQNFAEEDILIANIFANILSLDINTIKQLFMLTNFSPSNIVGLSGGDVKMGNLFSFGTELVKRLNLTGSTGLNHANGKSNGIVNGNKTLFAFFGSVKIYFKTCNDETAKLDTITLHAKKSLQILDPQLVTLHELTPNPKPKLQNYPIEIDDATLLKSAHELNKLKPGDFSRVDKIQISQTLRDDTADFLILTPEIALKPETIYELYIPFGSELIKDLAGLYMSSYKEAGKEKYLSVTQFEATDARKAFPCFDEPALKATFDVSIVTRRNAVSNGPLEHSYPMANIGNRDWRRLVFATSPIMSTYLLALSENEFEVMNILKGKKQKRTSQSGVQFSIWVRPELKNQADYAILISPKILDFFENYFGIPFPLPKMDQIAVPDFSAGAMENWGLITYRESALLYAPNRTSLSHKYRVASIIAHEISHQWFGNLVTMDWWDDLWLNEGFASYMEYLGTDHIHPEWDIMSFSPIKDLQYTLNVDALTTSHPIYVKVQNPAEIGQIFDTISYSKGSAVIRMMNSILSETCFRNGLKSYLKTLAYKNAKHDDLWFHLQKESNMSGLVLADVMNTWILQMGFPLIEIRKVYPDSPSNHSSNAFFNIEIRQSYFLANRTAQWSTKYISPYNYTWYVPVTFVHKIHGEEKVSRTHLVWLNRSDATVSVSYPSNHYHHKVGRRGRQLSHNDAEGEIKKTVAFTPAEWILGNVKQTGLYRVMYDRSNWELLLSQLMTNHEIIDPINRAQILDDLFTFAKSGYVTYDLPMRATKYLIYEQAYLPWTAVLEEEFSYLGEMFGRRPCFGEFKGYMQELIWPQYKRIGWNHIPETDLKNTMLQEDIIKWSCMFEVDSCVEEAKRRYRRLMTTNMSTDLTIQPHLRTIVYCYAIAYGGTEEWNFAWNQYQTEQNSQEKMRYLVALGCSREPWLLNKLLHSSFNESMIRGQDISTLLRSVALNNQIGRMVSWAFIRNNWQAIQKKWGNNYWAMDVIISIFTYGRNTREETQEVIQFLNTRPEAKSTLLESSWNQNLEKISLNYNWLNQHEQTVCDWLRELKPYFEHANKIVALKSFESIKNP